MENPKTEMQNEIKSDKHLTEILIAAALIILGVIFIIIALNQPRENADKSVDSTVKSSVSDNADVSSDKITSNKNDNTIDKGSVSFPINLNTCSAEDLMAIDNVGETRANAIIAYREHLGGYTSVEQLKNISGIGDSVYASIAPYVTV
ncbi:MAG: helix-hairpin-helix domain-containing protein [Eubacterium sp.]|nr:helix-hairpin-helix domain-containing protein [Eubacterium sp.]